jgi:hypothetical protein
MVVVAGCASPTVEDFKQSYAYEPEKSPAQINAGGAKILYSATFSSSDALWGDKTVEASACTAREIVTLHDLVASELFANEGSVSTLDPALHPSEVNQKLRDADVRISVDAVESYDSNQETSLRVTMRVTDAPSGMVLKSYSWSQREEEHALQNALSQLKAGLVKDFGDSNFKRLCAQSAHPDPADLEGLLVSKEFSIDVARARNRALIAANTLTLPGIIQGQKTADLVNLKVKIEQTIFDLEHVAEIDKEQAEASTASGGDAGELREMSLVYRERIEILKPMLEGLKQEIVNRGK